MSTEEISLGKIKNTGRGFQIIHFEDLYKQRCSLQQSSLAVFEPPGTSAIWLGADSTGITPTERMHLEQEQVQALVVALQNWLDAGFFQGKENEDAP